MEKKAYIYLIFYFNSESKGYEALKEAIANHFVSKKANDNFTIVLSDKEERPVNIYEKLTKKISEEDQGSLGLFILSLTDYYGILETSVWEWLEENTNEKLREPH